MLVLWAILPQWQKCCVLCHIYSGKVEVVHRDYNNHNIHRCNSLFFGVRPAKKVKKWQAGAMSKQSRPGSRSPKSGRQRPQRRPRTTSSRPPAADVSLVPPAAEPQPAVEPEVRTRTHSSRPKEPARRNSRPASSRRFRRKKQQAPQFQPTEEAQPDTFGARLRRFLPVVGLPHAIVLALIISCAVIGVLASSMENATLPSTIAISWLFFQLGPVAGGNISINMLPALPALLLAFALVRRIRKSVAHRISLVDLGVLAGVTIFVPVTISIIAWLMLYDASAVYPVGPPNFFAILGNTILLNAVIFVLGLGKKLWSILSELIGLGAWLIDAIAAALRAMIYLLIVGTALVLISMFAHAAEIGDILEGYTTLGIVAVSLLSLLYLPNAALFASGLASGSELLIGQAHISVFDVVLVPLPPLPLFAAVPASAGGWTQVLLVVPIAISCFVAWNRLRDYGQVLVFSLVVGLSTLVANTLVSGTLGVYGYTGLHWWMTPLLTMFWAAIGATVAVLIGAYQQRKQERANAPVLPHSEPTQVSDSADEYYGDRDSADLEEVDAEVIATDDIEDANFGSEDLGAESLEAEDDEAADLAMQDLDSDDVVDEDPASTEPEAIEVEAGAKDSQPEDSDPEIIEAEVIDAEVIEAEVNDISPAERASNPDTTPQSNAAEQALNEDPDSN